MIILNENKKNILSTLRNLGPKTKFDLASILNISIPTITSNVNELINDKIILTDGFVDVAYGRKPILLNLNHSRYLSLGIDIKDGILYYSIMNLNLDIISSKSYTSNNNNLFNSIKDIIKQVIFEYDSERLIGIGISYPGIVDPDSLILKVATNIGLTHIDLTPLSLLFNIPLYVANEANLAAFSEITMGNGKAFNSCIYLSINQGLGGGIVFDGNYYNGSHNLAGEIGHMIIERNGKLCTCGAKGCAEAYLSIYSLIELFNINTNSSTKNLNELFDLFDFSNDIHLKTLHNYIDNLIIVINNLYLIFDPMCIIIGGELSIYKEVFSDYISSSLNNNTSKLLSPKRHLLYSSLMHNASKYGACLIALESISHLK